VSEWIEEGLKLSEIQSKLGSEFGLSVTYMEMRFLLADLGLQPKDKPEPEPAKPLNPPAQAPTAAPISPLEAGALPASGVSVTVDQVTRAGALVSGRVAFSDGKKAEWYLDQTGRLGLAGTEPGYRPSEDDLMDFQTELQSQLAKLGY
jgi:hypothetical protein